LPASQVLTQTAGGNRGRETPYPNPIENPFAWNLTSDEICVNTLRLQLFHPLCRWLLARKGLKLDREETTLCTDHHICGEQGHEKEGI
jgi:hypothetical protein